MKKSIPAVALTIIFVLSISGPPLVADETDERIVNSLMNSYVFRTYLAHEDIRIESDDGYVVLSGTVSEEYQKTLADDTAAGMPGVRNVDNRLELKGGVIPAGSDALLIAKVKASLLFHKHVSVLKTEVDARDGVVILRGEAASQEQKDLTYEYVMDVDGVKEVINEMVVAGAVPSPPTPEKRSVGETIDDASITAQVKMSLLFHRVTSGLRTRVETRRGVVSLYGKANSGAEKDLATELAYDIKGVKKVRNRMVVE